MVMFRSIMVEGENTCILALCKALCHGDDLLSSFENFLIIAANRCIYLVWIINLKLILETKNDRNFLKKNIKQHFCDWINYLINKKKLFFK